MDYNIPDIKYFSSKNTNNDFFTWIPDKIYIVLGRSNKKNSSLRLENLADEIILQRPSGGETVILTPKTLVISKKENNVNLGDSWKYFQKINLEIIKKLENLGINNLIQKGISDIAIGEKKILGSAMFRKKDTLFYHAVLNISETTDIFEKYLKHPSREPDYRQGRCHKEFVTSLNAEGYNYFPEEIAESFNKKSANQNLF